MAELRINADRVSAKDSVPFECAGCAECCRHVRESVPLESLDIFRLARHLRETGADVNCTDDVIVRYGEPVLLHECGFFVVMLKTTGENNACIFLENNRCTIHAANPRACRIYPFIAEPKEDGGFGYLVTRERTHHFDGPSIRVKSWMKQHFSQEDREFLSLDYGSARDIARSLRRIPEERRTEAVFHFLRYKYSDFNLDKPFLPQYQRNLKRLLCVLAQMADHV